MNANQEHERQRHGVVSQVAVLQAWGGGRLVQFPSIYGKSYSQKPGHPIAAGYRDRRVPGAHQSV